MGFDRARSELRRHVASRNWRPRSPNFGFSVPAARSSVTCSPAFEFLGVILVTAIPFGIYDLVEAIDNVESASVAGDSFPTTRVLTADGVVSLIGCLMGNPFINAVYIGHPGWKAMGGRIGYSAATGVMVLFLSWFGIISVLVSADSGRRHLADLALHRHADRCPGVPGDTASKHAPAIVLALTPHLAAWGKLQIDNALGAAGTNAHAVGLDKLGQVGVLYDGLAVLGGGSILGGLILGAIGAFIIDREFTKASAFALAGACADVLRLHARRSDRDRANAGRRLQLLLSRRFAFRVREVRKHRSGTRRT